MCSPAYGELYDGDLIIKINNQESKLLNHYQAEDLIKNSGKELFLTVKRDHKNNFLPKISSESLCNKKQMINDIQNTLTRLAKDGPIREIEIINKPKENKNKNEFGLVFKNIPNKIKFSPPHPHPLLHPHPLPHPHSLHPHPPLLPPLSFLPSQTYNSFYISSISNKPSNFQQQQQIQQQNQQQNQQKIQQNQQQNQQKNQQKIQQNQQQKQQQNQQQNQQQIQQQIQQNQQQKQQQNQQQIFPICHFTPNPSIQQLN